MPSGDDPNFLRRWSRLKREATLRPVAHGEEQACALPAELPPLESLNFESDFGAFMRAEVDDAVRRAALKKLFRDPRFKVMDGLDVYIDDYSREDPIPSGMLAQLQHARTTLFGPEPLQESGKENESSEEPLEEQRGATLASKIDA